MTITTHGRRSESIIREGGGSSKGCRTGFVAALAAASVLCAVTLPAAHGFASPRGQTTAAFAASTAATTTLQRPKQPFASPSYRTLVRNRRPAGNTGSSSSRLHLSLEENWDELARSVSSQASRLNLGGGDGAGEALLDDLVGLANRLYETATGQSAFPGRELLVSAAAVADDAARFYASLPLWMEVSVIVAPLLTLAVAALYSALSFPPEDYREGYEPYVRGDYDPIQAKAYYRRHPLLVLQRVSQLLRLSNRFLFNWFLDKYVFRNEDETRPQRAQELLQLITKLGPTAIKVGQALSVRPDLIEEEYARALSTLQDQVPPFDDDKARQILQRELGQERYSRIQGMGGKRGPVASASIGQVYRCTVDGQDVAVKVQRPNVLSEIALDLYIVREFAPLYARITKSSTDLQSLANEWGRGFIAELDYRQEARSTIRFTEEMARRNLNAVCAPRVLTEYSTEQILVTGWVDGTRIDESDADDVPRLCSVALNAYLVMLLELQSLHCDPHPGNLLRTDDGKLCILDFGMTLDIDPNLQYSLLEYVAHLTSDNYGELPDDLSKLGFLKEDKVEFVKRSGILKPLEYFLQQAGKGGGAKGVRERIFEEYREKFPGLSDDELRVEMRSEMKQQMNEVVQRESVATGITMEVEELQRQNRDSFRIPEWFLYTSRAFLTLEGVSLQADDNYSIIKSCFPYVAKRLVADDDPRAVKALRDLLYGASDAVDVKRLADLADGFSSYTTTTKTINQQAKARDGEIVLADGDSKERVSKKIDRKNKMVEAEATITLVKDSADILLSPRGNLVQNLLVEEGALAASARVKDTIRSALVDGPKRFRDSLPFGAGNVLPPLPFENRVEPFVRKTSDEVKAQELAEKIAGVLPQPASPFGGGREHANGDEVAEPAAAATLVPSFSTLVANGDGNAANDFVSSLRELDPEQAALVLKEFRENFPRYAPLVGQLGNKFVSTLLRTASGNIESTLDDLEAAGERPDRVTRVAVRGLSSAAQRGAAALSSAHGENAAATTTTTP